MKKTLLLFFAVLMVIPAAGQLPDLHSRMTDPKKVKNPDQRRSFSDFISDPERSFMFTAAQKEKTLLKSQQVFTKQLDSVYVERYILLADQVEPDTKFEFAYDDQGNFIRETAHSWNPDNEQWTPDWMDEFVYDAEGRIVEELYYDWDPGAEDWLLTDRERYEFDPAGNMTEIIYSEWDPFEEKWEPYWKDELTYENGLLVEEISWVYDPDTGEWEFDWKIELDYDQNGNITEAISYEWDYMEEEWIPDFSYRNELDVEGNIMETLYFGWDEDIENWVNDWKQTYTRNEAGNPVEMISSEYNSGSGEWEPQINQTYLYDNSHNLTEETWYFWEESSEEWIPTQKYEYTIDTSYTTGEILAPFYFHGYFLINNMLTEINRYFHDGEDWRTEENTTLYYSDFEAADPDTYTLSINITGNGTVEVDGTPYSEVMSVAGNTDATLEAIAAEGWEFEGWSGDLASENAAETITMNSNKSITATFTEIVAEEFTLTLTIEGNGTVTVNGVSYTEALTVAAGTELLLGADAGEGWEFDGWSGDLTTENAAETIIMNSNMSITATFTEIVTEEFTLTLTIEGNGTVTVNGAPYTEALTVVAGIELTLEAIADEGNEFIEWTGDLLSAQPEEIVTMDEDKNITAIFSFVNSSATFGLTKPAVFPNPFSDNITINTSGDFKTLKITNLSGQTVRELNLDASGNRIIPTGELENGVYLFIFQTERGEREIITMVKH